MLSKGAREKYDWLSGSSAQASKLLHRHFLIADALVSEAPETLAACADPALIRACAAKGGE